MINPASIIYLIVFLLSLMLAWELSRVKNGPAKKSLVAILLCISWLTGFFGSALAIGGDYLDFALSPWGRIIGWLPMGISLTYLLLIARGVITLKRKP